MELEYRLKQKFFITLVVIIVLLPVVAFSIDYATRSSSAKSNIRIDTKNITGPLYFNWKALSQGGEEQGRMFKSIIQQLSELSPRYIRIDHIYDFYDVVRKQGTSLSFDWSRLDNTVCDIYRTGARPFFVLGYMPPDLSSDGSPISAPSNWEDWAEIVQKTIERYSGKSTVLCGSVQGDKLTNVYYEVWNEPDLETFGKWSFRDGPKDYRQLYYYSSLGAGRADNVRRFYLGGPSTTAAYKNWMQGFLDYVIEKDLRIDFLSWHHYTDDPIEFTSDVESIRTWLPQEKYIRYHNLPKIITEWGYDSQNNKAYDEKTGAAYTVAVVRNLIDQKIELALSYEARDGPQTNQGILTYAGEKKPRFEALRFLNMLEGYRLKVDGEGSFVKAIASKSQRKITVVLANYDKEGKNAELVPLTFANLTSGSYKIIITHLDGTQVELNSVTTKGENIQRSILMQPNNVSAVELIPLVPRP